MGPIKVPQASPKHYLKKHRMQPEAPSKRASGPTVLPLRSRLLTFSFSSRGGTSRLPRKEARRPRQQEQTATPPQAVRLCGGGHRRDATPRQDQASGRRRLPQGTQVFPPGFWTFPATREEKGGGGVFLDFVGFGRRGWRWRGGHRLALLFAGLWKGAQLHAEARSRAAQPAGGLLPPAASREGGADQEEAAEAAGRPAGADTPTRPCRQRAPASPSEPSSSVSCRVYATFGTRSPVRPAASRPSWRPA